MGTKVGSRRATPGLDRKRNIGVRSLRFVGALLVLTPTAHASDAETAEPDPDPVPATIRRFELGARVGLSAPLGAISGDSLIEFEEGNALATPHELGDFYSSRIPIALEVGYRALPNLVLSVYGQYGFISTKSGETCPSTYSSCTAHDLAIGVQGQYHFASTAALDPWLGLGIGYEILSWSDTSRLGGSPNGSYNGPQFANLEGGLDFKVASALAVGPFVNLSFAEFTNATENGQSSSIDPKALHEWLTIGIKGALGI